MRLMEVSAPTDGFAPSWADDPRSSIAIRKIAITACYQAAMIRFIFDLGIRLATFVALAAAFFRKPGAGLRARSQVCGSVVAIPCAIPCQFPTGAGGRGNIFPARGAIDLAQVIDCTRDHRQNRADFVAGTKNFPDIREIGGGDGIRTCPARGCRRPGRGRPGRACRSGRAGFRWCRRPRCRSGRRGRSARPEIRR